MGPAHHRYYLSSMTVLYLHLADVICAFISIMSTSVSNPTRKMSGKEAVPFRPLLIVAPSGFSPLPPLVASGAPRGIPKAERIQKAERIKRVSLIERYGQQAGRFRETTGNVAAIDFGTTFCSVAYTTVVTRYDGIATLKLNQVKSRVSTAILLKQNGSNSIQNFNADDPVIRSPVYEVDSFGYDAQKQHAKLRASERHKYLYFEHFKMYLHQDEVSVSGINA